MRDVTKSEKFQEIARLLRDGNGIADIANALGKNRNTIKSYVNFNRSHFIGVGAIPTSNLISEERKCQETLGVNIAQRDYLRSIGATRKFSAQRSNAAKRGISFELTLGDWWSIWDKSGKWSERGVGVGRYVMSRFGDKGPYAAGNVEIILSTQNNSDSWLPGRKRKAQRRNICSDKKLKGRPNLKLEDECVREIRSKYLKGSKTNGSVALAREYGVSNSLIWAIVSNKRRSSV